MATTHQVKIHHILLDGRSICQWAETEPWAKFFTCYYQWEPSARQTAMKIAAMACNKNRRVEVVAGRCPNCGG